MANRAVTWRTVSICSGAGLLDLGLEWAGFRTVQLCELDAPTAYDVAINDVRPTESPTERERRARRERLHHEWLQGLLARRFPGVPVHPDAWDLEPVECDVITAGFPCQPVSVAGTGRAQEDTRWLWPAITRSVRLARPRYVILENVPGLLQRGLGDVLGSLADLGYDAEWETFGAWQIGAPHQRDRVWIVATADADRSRVWDEHGGFFRPGWGTAALTWHHGQTRTVADADELGRIEGLQRPAGRRKRPWEGNPVGRSPIETGRQEAAARCSWWAVEPDVGRVAHRVPARMDRLRALGNGVVPQCAQLIGLRLRQLNDEG